MYQNECLGSCGSASQESRTRTEEGTVGMKVMAKNGNSPRHERVSVGLIFVVLESGRKIAEQGDKIHKSDEISREEIQRERRRRERSPCETAVWQRATNKPAVRPIHKGQGRHQPGLASREARFSGGGDSGCGLVAMAGMES